MPVLPFYAEEYGASATTLGLLLAVYAAAQFVFAPLWGRLSDRIGRRRVMILTVAGTAISLGALALADTLAGVFAARLLAGVFAANVGVASAYIISHLPINFRRFIRKGFVRAVGANAELERPARLQKRLDPFHPNGGQGIEIRWPRHSDTGRGHSGNFLEAAGAFPGQLQGTINEYPAVGSLELQSLHIPHLLPDIFHQTVDELVTVFTFESDLIVPDQDGSAVIHELAVLRLKVENNWR